MARVYSVGDTPVGLNTSFRVGFDINFTVEASSFAEVSITNVVVEYTENAWRYGSMKCCAAMSFTPYNTGVNLVSGNSSARQTALSNYEQYKQDVYNTMYAGAFIYKDYNAKHALYNYGYGNWAETGNSGLFGGTGLVQYIKPYDGNPVIFYVNVAFYAYCTKNDTSDTYYCMYGAVPYQVTISGREAYTVDVISNGIHQAGYPTTVYHGNTITLPYTNTAGRYGYTWNDKWSGYDKGFVYTVLSNVTFEAGWIADTKTITFDPNLNGGAGQGEVQNMPSPLTFVSTTDAYYPLPTTVPTRTGHTFAGWSWNWAASSGVMPGNSITITPDPNPKLYAIWTVNTYKLQFKTWTSMGGGVIYEISKNHFETIDPFSEMSKPAIDKYNFLGWSLTDGRSTPFANVDWFNGERAQPHVVTANTTFYTIWSWIQQPPVVTYANIARCMKRTAQEGGGWVLDDAGMFARVTFRVEFDMGGIPNLRGTYGVEYREENEETWKQCLMPGGTTEDWCYDIDPTTGKGTYTSTLPLSTQDSTAEGGFSIDNYYDIRIVIEDAAHLKTSFSTFISRGFFILDICGDETTQGKGIGIGSAAIPYKITTGLILNPEANRLKLFIKSSGWVSNTEAIGLYGRTPKYKQVFPMDPKYYIDSTVRVVDILQSYEDMPDYMCMDFCRSIVAVKTDTNSITIYTELVPYRNFDITVLLL